MIVHIFVSKCFVRSAPTHWEHDSNDDVTRELTNHPFNDHINQKQTAQ